MASSAKRRTKDSKAPNAKRKRKLSESEVDGPGLAFLSSKYAERPASKIYNSHFRHSTPAELFRKDLISAMKMPDSEPLSPDEYVVIDDPWKPEWEKGVQVPVEPDALPEPTMRILRKRNKNSNFKLPKKLIRFTRDNFFNPEIHVMSYTNTLAERTCRYDMDDVDFQWLTLVNQDREDFGLQPLEETAFEQIIEELEVQAYVNFQATIKSEEGLGLEYDEDAICDVCRSPDSVDENQMVFCDSCNICVHQVCYGITKIPEGSWICRTCTLGIRPACALCPNRGGAMKTTRCGQKWAHVGCAVWIPEVQFLNYIKMEPIIKISEIKPKRWTQTCVLCNEKGGACIQCSEKGCKTPFHVTCAFKEGLKMMAHLKNHYRDKDKLKAYCKKHSKRKHRVSSESELEDQSTSQGDEENEAVEQLSSEERANLRQKKIHEKEAEFYNYVSMEDIAELFQYDKCDIELIFNYWKLKRKANWNRPLLPPKIDTENSCSMENSQFNFLKKLVHHRQDLERARNLCYMVIKREKLTSSWVRCKEATFLKQAGIMSKHSKKLSKHEIEAVLNAGHGDLAYDKKHTGNKRPSPNVARVLSNLVGEDLSKIPPNGVVKANKKSEKVKAERTPNPYAKHYLNGLLKRSQRWLATVDKQKLSKISSDAPTTEETQGQLSFTGASDPAASDDGLDMSRDFDLNLLEDHSCFIDENRDSSRDKSKQEFSSEISPDKSCLTSYVEVKLDPSTDCSESGLELQAYLKNVSDCEKGTQPVSMGDVTESSESTADNPNYIKSMQEDSLLSIPNISDDRVFENQVEQEIEISNVSCSDDDVPQNALQRLIVSDNVFTDHEEQEIRIEILDESNVSCSNNDVPTQTKDSMNDRIVIADQILQDLKLEIPNIESINCSNEDALLETELNTSDRILVSDHVKQDLKIDIPYVDNLNCSDTDWLKRDDKISFANQIKQDIRIELCDLNKVNCGDVKVLKQNSLQNKSNINDSILLTSQIMPEIKEIKIEISDVMNSINCSHDSNVTRGLKNILKHEKYLIKKQVQNSTNLKAESKPSIKNKSDDKRSSDKQNKKNQSVRKESKKSKDLLSSNFKRKTSLQETFSEDSTSGERGLSSNDTSSKKESATKMIIQNNLINEKSLPTIPFVKLSPLEDEQFPVINQSPSRKDSVTTSEDGNLYEKVTKSEKMSDIKLLKDNKIENVQKTKQGIQVLDPMCNKEKTGAEFPNKPSPLRTSSPTSVKIIENGSVKVNKLSPKHIAGEKSITSAKVPSGLKLKSINNALPMPSPSSVVNRQRAPSPSKCQEKASPVSKSVDSDSSDTKDGLKGRDVTNCEPPPLLKKDIFRGYRIPKKTRTDKPEESSMDLKRGSSPLSPLPDFTSTLSGFHTTSKTSWRQITPRSTVAIPTNNSVPAPLSNGDVESLSERLVITLKKDPSDPDSQRWKADGNHFRRGAASGIWIGEYPSNHINTLHPHHYPPRPPRNWTNIRNHHQYRPMRIGYGPPPPFT